MRALHVIGGGDTGGAMAHLVPLLAALRRGACDARLLCLGGGGLADTARDRGLPTEVLPMSTPWDPRVLPALRRRLFMTGWDVVHTHGMRANVPVRLLRPSLSRGAAGRLRGPRGRPQGPSPPPRAPCLFTTVHSDLELDYTDAVRRRLFPALDRMTLGGVDRIVCVSDDLRRLLQSRGYPANRLLVISSGVEFEPEGSVSPVLGRDPVHRPSGRDPAVTAAVWGDRPPGAGAPRVGTVARAVPVKDLDLFLEVIALLAPTLPALRAAAVGEGPERGRLAARAQALGLDGVVVFPGEVRPGARAVHEFDLFLLTSESEGIPLTVLEAMAAGVPVVATDVGGVGEAVVDGVTGILVARAGDRAAVAAGLAEHVLALMRDPARRERMGAAGTARARDVFSTDASARETIVAYRACLESGDSRTGET